MVRQKFTLSKLHKQELTYGCYEGNLKCFVKPHLISDSPRYESLQGTKTLLDSQYCLFMRSLSGHFLLAKAGNNHFLSTF